MDRLIPTFAHRLGGRLLGLFCFNRILVFGTEHVAAEGAVLYLGLHRNGAVDGVPYLMAAPSAAYMISAQLQRTWAGRRIFRGIGAARRKDRDRGIHADNALATQLCVSHLAAGGSLFILPEGTSTLGPRHLPFRPGATAIIKEFLQHGCQLRVIPLAVNYECAWKWQSRIEVVIGEALMLTGADAVSADDLAARTTAALEKVGINVDSEEDMRLVERLAFVGTYVSKQSYSRCLKHFGSGIRADVRETEGRLQVAVSDVGAHTYQGIPLLPSHDLVTAAAAWLAFMPLISGCLLLNMPPVLIAFIASRKLPDDSNVVAFWRTVVGAPAALVWCLGLVIGLCAFRHSLLASMYVAVSVLGVRLFRRFRLLTVAVYNGFFADGIRQPLTEHFAAVQRSLESMRG